MLLMTERNTKVSSMCGESVVTLFALKTIVGIFISSGKVKKKSEIIYTVLQSASAAAQTSI